MGLMTSSPPNVPQAWTFAAKAVTVNNAEDFILRFQLFFESSGLSVELRGFIGSPNLPHSVPCISPREEPQSRRRPSDATEHEESDIPIHRI